MSQETDTLALFSDVHGNRLAMEAVLDDLEASGIYRVYCLGDLVGYGPHPNGVIDLLQARDVLSILGNYDEGVGWETGDCGCFYPDEDARRIGEASYAFTVAEVTAERKAYLRTLPRELHVSLADKKVHLVHGSPRRVNEYLARDRDQRTYLRLAEAEADDVLCFGHTHDPWFRSFGGKLFVNVGSVGRPKDGDSRAAYVVLRASLTGPIAVEIRRVAYDVEAAAQAVVAAGLPFALADMLRGTPQGG
ncbi:MAG: metallophosphoesterase family protein [Thermoleophilia bacterium]|nr:metallophosphoesterase family protein [Thermoleophilia bacterium]